MKRITVDLKDAGDYRRDNYGVLMESVTRHTVTGKGVHNRGYNHRVDIWENRPSRARDADPSVIVDPHGNPTAERYSYLLKAEAGVIAAHPYEREPQGADLAPGDVLTLRIYGYDLGDFQIRVTRAFHDPELVLVDTASSASVQHYIDTGDYLTPAEAEAATFRGELLR